MMDDGLRTRTKIGNLPLGGGVDLEGGSPRKNHGLGHNFGASLSSHQASKMFWSIRVLVTDQFSVNYWSGVRRTFLQSPHEQSAHRRCNIFFHSLLHSRSGTSQQRTRSFRLNHPPNLVICPGEAGYYVGFTVLVCLWSLAYASDLTRWVGLTTRFCVLTMIRRDDPHAIKRDSHGVLHIWAQSWKFFRITAPTACV